MESKVDLHVHSKYSDRPAEWFLRRIGAPESFTEPQALHETCKAHGMDFVTITDHNSIEGALEIAHLPDTFLSAEVTTYFPEDGGKVHCLVWDITQDQFRDIQQARPSIYDLQKLLLEEGILHAVAHPLYSVNERLTVGHVEKLALLFNRFETFNGSLPERLVRTADAMLRNLTAEKIAELADRHGIEPVGKTPWRKAFTGGSDDHSGIYAGVAYTVTPPAQDVGQFLRYVRQGAHAADGRAGSSLAFAHSLYHIGYGYYKQRLLNGTKPRNRVVGALFQKLLGGHGSASPTLRERIGGLFSRFLVSLHKRRLSRVERVLVEQLQQLFKAGGAPESEHPLPSAGADEQTFRTACHLSQQFGYLFLRKCFEYAAEGELIDCIQTVSALGPVALGIAPYLAAFGAQHKDDSLAAEVARRFGCTHGARLPGGRALMADATLTAVPTLWRSAASADGDGAPLTLLSCGAAPAEPTAHSAVFSPVGWFELPERRARVPFPPFLEIIGHIERRGYDELLLASPGLMGLTGLLAARLLGLRTTAVYHPEFCSLVRHLTGEEELDAVARRYVLWFLGQADCVLVASEGQRLRLCEQGLDHQRVIVIAPSGAEAIPTSVA